MKYQKISIEIFFLLSFDPSSKFILLNEAFSDEFSTRSKSSQYIFIIAEEFTYYVEAIDLVHYFVKKKARNYRDYYHRCEYKISSLQYDDKWMFYLEIKICMETYRRPDKDGDIYYISICFDLLQKKEIDYDEFIMEATNRESEEYELIRNKLRNELDNIIPDDSLPF